MSDKKKTCFVITPIGDENSEIRRHIDGIIDQVIEPAIGDKYKIIVSHREFEIGSINDRIIRSVYESDLVIANLTNTNPNVMFELAIRYSFGKPAIVIAEKGTKLPFDVIDQNTIFYVNDLVGADDLRKEICKYENKIVLDKRDYGPVYKVINKIPLYNEVESGAKTGEDVPSGKMMQYIIGRLNNIEQNINSGNQNRMNDLKDINEIGYSLTFIDHGKNGNVYIRNSVSYILFKYGSLSTSEYENLTGEDSVKFSVIGSFDEVGSALLELKSWAKVNDIEMLKIRII